MTVSLQEMIARQSPENQAVIAERSAELIADLTAKQKATRGTLGIALPGDTGRPEGDFYRTPEAATLALIEREQIDFVLEPACGDGAISKVLQLHFPGRVHSSDLHDHGFGGAGVDFLDVTMLPVHGCSIVTNPPFKLAADFARHGLALGAPKVCLFLRLAFMEGQRRYESGLWRHLHRVWVFTERQTLWRGGHAREGEKKGGMIAFAWFVFESNPRYGQFFQVAHIPPTREKSQ